MIAAVRSLTAILLLLALPASAAPPSLQRAELMLKSTATEVEAIEPALDSLIASARAVAESNGQRDPVLLLGRHAAIIDRRADALSRKAEHLAATVEELALALSAP